MSAATMRIPSFAVDASRRLSRKSTLPSSEGIFAETAGGVVVAGLKKLALEGKVAPDEVTVAYITGSGLKTQEAIEDALQIPLHIEPTMAAFERALGERETAREHAAAV